MRFFFAVALALATCTTPSYACRWKLILGMLERSENPSLQELRMASTEILQGSQWSVSEIEDHAMGRAATMVRGTIASGKNPVLTQIADSRTRKFSVDQLRILGAFERAYIDHQLNVLGSFSGGEAARKAIAESPEILICIHCTPIKERVDKALSDRLDLMSVPKLNLVSNAYPHKGKVPQKSMFGYSEDGELGRSIKASKIHLMGGDSYECLLRTGQEAIASSLRHNTEVEVILDTNAIYTNNGGKTLAQEMAGFGADKEGFILEEAPPLVAKIPGIQQTGVEGNSVIFTNKGGRTVRITFR